jgi:amino acid adenylation domain-containing protein/thioester reductase-like protein
MAITYGDENISYVELGHLVDNVKNNLISKFNITKSDVIGIQIQKGIEGIIVILGALKTGATIVFVDTLQPLKRQLYLLKNSSCSYIISEKSDQSKLDIDRITISHITSLYQGIDHKVKINPQDNAYIIYTSGTTGKPKGALIDHAGLENMAFQQSQQFNMSSNDRLAHFASYSFDAAIAEIFETLVSGSTLVIPTNDDIKKDPIKLMAFLDNHNVTILTVTPSFLRNLKPRHLRNLRMILVVGERLSSDLIYKFNGDLEIYNSYGVSECSICTTIFKIGKPFLGKVLIGKPIKNTEILIVDKNLKEIPNGEIGEMLIGGVGVAKCYVKNESLTSKKFVRIQFKTGIYYRTGDLGRVEIDGNLSFHGRVDDQIKIRGIRIEPKEIELILNSYKRIYNSHVISKDYENSSKLIAFIEKGNYSLNKQDVKKWLLERLPRFMIPNLFIILDKFPLTIGGKLNQKLLYKNIPIREKSDKQETVISVNQKISNIFKKVLNIQDIEEDKNVFDEYGCDSLLALTIVVEIEEELGIPISTSLLTEFPTISQFIKLGLKSPKYKDLDNYKIDKSIKKVIANSTKGEIKNNYLITGATSKLGIELMKLIALDKDIRIFCLMRANSLEDAFKRIDNIIQNSMNLNMELTNRIKPIIGNISLPNLGLSYKDYNFIAEKIDRIYHFAADVNHIKSFELLFNTNVRSIQELVKLCSKSRIKLIHISSCAVFLSSKINRKSTFNERTLLEFAGFGKSSGYSLSKYCAEFILNDLTDYNFDYQIHRLDIIEGEEPINSSLQWIDILISICSKTKLAFKNDELNFDLAPQKSCSIAKAIFALSNLNNSNEKIYHNFPNTRISLSVYLQLKFSNRTDINFVTFDQWIQKISLLYESDRRAKSLIFILRDIQKNSRKFMIKSTRTTRILKTLNINLSNLILHS